MFGWIAIAIVTPIIAAVFGNTIIRVVPFNRRVNIGAVLTFIILFVFRGLRKYTVGGDLATYRLLFNTISRYSWSQTLDSKGYEKGFLVLNKLLCIVNEILKLEEGFQLLLISTALIFTAALVYFVFQYSSNPPISLFAYITLAYLGATFNNERQAIAIAFLLFSIKYIKERKLWKFLALVLLASLFHITSIVFIALYWIYDIRIDAKYWIRVLVVGIVCFVLSPLILRFLTSHFFTKYSGFTDALAGSGYNYLIFLIFMLSSTFIITSEDERNKEEMRLIIHMMVLAIITQEFATIISFIYRATRLFDVAMILYFPYFFKKIKGSIVLKMLFFVLLMGLFVMMLENDNLELVPYRWCWE